MASKERIQRLKEETRTNILEASFRIAKEEGWQALSMRRIADVIEYTAPIIYEYFSSKDAILLELTRRGYLILSRDLQSAKSKHRPPAAQLEEMWLAYWSFAFANKELYQLMFGVQINSSCEEVKKLPESEVPSALFSDVIRELIQMEDPSPDMVCAKYYAFWSVVHGLICINIVRGGSSDEINKQVLTDAIASIISSINACSVSEKQNAVK
jgi:AcrR family transcriptional regulator